MIEQEISEGEEIYKQNVLEHYKNPHNFGEIENPSLKIEDSNPLCGDKIEISARIENGKIVDIKFKGQGCAISIASASMLTDKIKGMSIEDVKKFGEKEILEIIGIKLNTIRIKCGLLGLKTLLKGLQGIKNE